MRLLLFRSSLDSSRRWPGALIGGAVTVRFGILRSLIVCGVLQSAGNLFYVVYLSSLCSPVFTATQYALLSSLASVGRTLVASSGGVLADKLGWVPFFLLTTVATLD